MIFKALIDSVHLDPKKGSVKIVLVLASHISLDELTTIGPRDETIRVTLESEQTKLEVREPEKQPYLKEADPDDVPDDEGEEGNSTITLKGEDAVVKLKEAAERLKEGDEDEVEGGGQEV